MVLILLLSGSQFKVNHITKCNDRNGLYARMQSAYRPNHSTETALLRVHNDISLALDSNKIDDVILVLLDLSSACDMVNYQILLKRLQDRYGIYGTVLDWLKSYLSEHT